MTKENDTSQTPHKAKHPVGQGEAVAGEAQAYKRAERQAIASLDQGFHLGGAIHVSRDEWHER